MKEGDTEYARAEWLAATHALGKALRNLVPIDDIPPGCQIIWAAVLILQIVGMLPDIVAHDREEAVGEGAILVGGRGDGQFAVGADDQPRPARAETLGARIVEGRFELIEAAEVEVMALARSPVGSPPPLGFMICQNMLWLAWPPPLLRTAVRIASGTLFRLRIKSSTLMFSNWRCPCSAVFTLFTYA